MKIDLSVVLTIHDETPFLRRTFASLGQAASFARAQALAVELIVVLDRPTSSARSWVENYQIRDYAQHTIIEVNNGSAGLSRNDGIAVACGEYIATADADDLVSYNFFTGMYGTALAEGPNAIICAEHTCSFGDQAYWRVYSSSDDVSPIAFFGGNPFSSRVLAHRHVFDEVRYCATPDRVNAFEDWHFNCQSIAAGYRFEIARSVILFYRQRANSITDRSHDHIMRYSELFAPELYKKYCTAAYLGINQQTRLCDFETLPRIEQLLSSAVVTELVEAAGELDPAINLEQISTGELGYALSTPVAPGCAYYEAINVIGDTPFTDVFLMSHPQGSVAEKGLLDALNRHTQSGSDSKILVILDAPWDAARDPLCSNPQITLVDLFSICRKWEINDNVLLALRLLQSLGSQVGLHLDAGPLTRELYRRYRLAIEHPAFFYYFRNDLIDQDRLADSVAFNFISDFSDALRCIVLDNRETMRFLEQRLEFRPNQLQPKYFEYDKI